MYVCITSYYFLSLSSSLFPSFLFSRFSVISVLLWSLTKWQTKISSKNINFFNIIKSVFVQESYQRKVPMDVEIIYMSIVTWYSIDYKYSIDSYIWLQYRKKNLEIYWSIEHLTFHEMKRQWNNEWKLPYKRIKGCTQASIGVRKKVPQRRRFQFLKF